MGSTHDGLSLIPWAWNRIRLRAAHSAKMFGARLYVWHLDLSLALKPKPAGTRVARGPVWPALVIIAFLASGVASAGALMVVAARQLTSHREAGR